MQSICEKNILYLLPTDDNQYLNFIYDELTKYLTNIYRLNVVDYSHQYGIRNTEKHIQDLITNKKIDIVFSTLFATEYQLSVEFYPSLKNKTKIVFWMFDDEMYFDAHSKYYCQVADAVITGDYFSISSYKRLGIPAIPCFSAYSKEEHYPIDIEKDIDVSFSGNCSKIGRMNYINFLIENGIDIKTFGVGSETGYVERNEFLKIYSRSKINLNFTKIDKLNWINKDEPLLNRMRQNKGRPVEIALTKSFCLSEYAPILEITFEIGKEIDVFYDKEELLEKIKYYLSNDKKREEMAENAYKRAIENYEADVHVPKILKELEKILEKNDKQKTEKIEIYLSPAFKIKSINGLTFSMFVLIKNGKILYALELFRELFKYGIFVFLAGFYGGIIRIIKNINMRLLKNPLLVSF